MLTKYQQWIDDNVSPHPDEVRGLCGAVAVEMIEAFPELRMRHGFFGGHPHWWCVDPSNTIIDPTRHQFPFDGQYDEALQCGEYRDTVTSPVRMQIPFGRAT